MNIPEEIFQSYDIRGIYPSQLNEENVVAITKAIYKFFQEKSRKEILKIAVGQDMRLSSSKLFEAISKTLVGLGAEVIDLGLVSTPTLYFAVFKNKFDSGIQITASHNPKEWNGLKMVLLGNNGLIKVGRNTGMDDIKKYSIQGVNLKKIQGGITQLENILDAEIKNALEITHNPKIKKLKIVADTANAMASLYIDGLFKVIPGDLIKMNFELDGTFPAHPADPLESKNLVDIQKKVLEEKADLGLATDGDGDRLFFIDNNGRIIPPSIITALVAKEILKLQKGAKIIADIRYILTPKKIVEDHEGIFILTKVGHAFISKAMSDEEGIFAGESSGHYYFKETGNAEAQLPVILFVLKVLTEEERKLSQIIADLKRSHESGEINFKVKNTKELIGILKQEYSDGEINTMDGIAISYPDWRFSLRASNTESLLRLNIESIHPEEVIKRKEEIINLIEKHAAKS